MKNTKLRTLTMCALLTAIVFILQYLGSFIKFGPFSISLVLLPIVIGAATCGIWAGAWLGLVFGAAVLFSGDAAWFMSFSVPGTILVVLLKGTLAGLCAGLVYKLLENVNEVLATAAAAVICPVVNTGIFALGCFTVFIKDLTAAAPAGQSAAAFIFLTLIGANFLFELLVNVLLTPAIVRVLKIKNF